MLTLLIGKDWVSNRDEVLKLISQDVKAGLADRILIVPELISHDMERRLCFAAGDTASRFAEVLSFTRLARRVADSLAIASMECLDNGGRVVAMAAASRQLHSQLKAYASVETRPEFLTGLIDAVDEFKRCCIGAQDLKSAAQKTQGGFAQKLEELSLLLEAYDGICARGRRDPRDQMTWLLEKLEDSDFGERHTFYIDGFPDFTRQHFAILEYLMRVSPHVTVSLTCDKPGSGLLSFEKAGLTAAELIKSAKQADIPFRIRYIQPDACPTEYIRERIFQGSISRRDNDSKRLILGRGETPYQECIAAAKRIMELVRGGARFRNIGVVCTDMATYQHLISLVFHRFGISFYQSGTENILEKSLISTVLSAMDAALGGFEQKDVLRYLKSALSPLDMKTVDLLENYSFLWNIQGSRWLSDWEYHPNGLGEAWTESSRRKLEKLNQARSLALTPLVQLRDDFRGAARMRDQIISLYRFFERISLSEHLGKLADRLDRDGDNRSAQILNQLWEILLSALEQLYDMLGDTAWDAPTFTRLFTLLLSQYDVGTIPPVLDAVTIGPVSAMRCHQMDHLIILGAEEGLLPGYGGGSGVLTDQERVQLRQMGVPLTGGSLDGLQAEFAEIYGVFCAARVTVMLSSCGEQPSFVFRRLAQMTTDIIDFSQVSQVADSMDAAAELVRLENVDFASRLGIFSTFEQLKKQSKYSLGHISEERIPELYGEKLRLSASQVDRQADCRFSYFLRYGLRAKERLQADVNPAEFGTYVHAVLEETAKEIMSMGGFHRVSLEETIRIAEKHSEAYSIERFHKLDSQRMKYLFNRNMQELKMVVEELWRELSASDFYPVDFEVAFGDGEIMDAIEISGAKIPAQLRGFVDRVDAWNNGATDYFRVVDYKTGNKDFDYCDIFNGLGLQMLLYLFALEQGGHSILGERPVPVGVQYFPARSPLISSSGKLTQEEALAEHGKGWKRRGLVLADADVLDAMEPEGAPKRLSCKRGKDGLITGDVADRDQLKMLKRYVFHVLRGLVNEIASGIVEPNPYTRGTSHDPCSYCPYSQVCHSATVPGRRNYKTMTSQRFWEEIGKELNQSG